MSARAAGAPAETLIPLVITFARRDARRDMRVDVTVVDLARADAAQSVRLVAPGL